MRLGLNRSIAMCASGVEPPRKKHKTTDGLPDYAIPQSSRATHGPPRQCNGSGVTSLSEGAKDDKMLRLSCATAIGGPQRNCDGPCATQLSEGALNNDLSLKNQVISLDGIQVVCGVASNTLGSQMSLNYHLSSGGDTLEITVSSAHNNQTPALIASLFTCETEETDSVSVISCLPDVEQSVRPIGNGIIHVIFTCELEETDSVSVVSCLPDVTIRSVLTSRGRRCTSAMNEQSVRPIGNGIMHVTKIQTSNDLTKSEIITENRESFDTVEAVMLTMINHVSELSDLMQEIPQSYNQAKNSPEWDKWRIACETEMEAHRLNQTFTPVPCPKGCSVMGCRWVYVVKDSGLYKARLVAKGFTQIEGVNYQETFSPVIRHTSLRLLLAIATQNRMAIHSMDVTAAFLHGKLDEEFYMKQVPGYHQKHQETQLKALNMYLSWRNLFMACNKRRLYGMQH